MLKIEDFSFDNSSSIDDFYSPPKIKHNPGIGSRYKVASLNSLNGFVRIASDKLVRVSQQDFWRLAKDDETGEFFIERLADDNDGPVKG